MDFKGKNNTTYIDGRTTKNYYCIDCGKEISYTSGFYGKGRCKSCANKNRKNKEHYNVAENHPRYIDNITKEILVKEYIKNKKTLKQIAKLFNCNYSVIVNRLKKYNIKVRTIGEARKFVHIKGTYEGDYYKGIWMRSSYEIKFAQFLDLSEIKWLYEPEVFDLDNTTYTPDFYIPEWDLYVEVKGWWRKQAKTKFMKFKKQYIDKNIEVFDKKRLLKLGVL